MITNYEEITLLYLLSGSCEVLPSSYVKLRSYLNIHTSNLADQLNLKLPKNFDNRSKTCPYCYSPWDGDTTSFKVFPSKKLRRYNTDKAKNKMVQSNELRNTLVLKCKVCSKKSSFSLIKRKPVKKVLKNETVKKVTEDESVKSIKRKKKKDKTCGLAVNVKTIDSFFPGIVIPRKKKRIKNSVQNKSDYSNLTFENSHNQLKSSMKSNLLNDEGKKLIFNPYALQVKGKFSGIKDEKLQRLKRAIKKEKNLDRKTLKDFLTLI